jgi:hypothetical protein
MDEKKMTEIIRAALEQYYETEEEGCIQIQSFEDEGVMTYNEGLVIRTDDGKFQLTIVECR